jgi:hypothetical protein
MRQELDLGHISGCSIGRSNVSIAQQRVRSTLLLSVGLPNATKYAQFERLVAMSTLDWPETGD